MKCIVRNGNLCFAKAEPVDPTKDSGIVDLQLAATYNGKEIKNESVGENIVDALVANGYRRVFKYSWVGDAIAAMSKNNGVEKMVLLNSADIIQASNSKFIFTNGNNTIATNNTTNADNTILVIRNKVLTGIGTWEGRKYKIRATEIKSDLKKGEFLDSNAIVSSQYRDLQIVPIDSAKKITIKNAAVNLSNTYAVLIDSSLKVLEVYKASSFILEVQNYEGATALVVSSINTTPLSATMER